MFTEFNNSKCHHFIGFMDGCLSLPHYAALTPPPPAPFFFSHTNTHSNTPPATITMIPIGAALWKMTGGLYQGLLNPVTGSHSELQAKASYNTHADTTASLPYMVTAIVT